MKKSNFLLHTSHPLPPNQPALDLEFQGLEKSELGE